jgi:hypothetical protein
MDRRGFLKLFSAAAIVVPVAPKYFFAPQGGWAIGVDRALRADFTAVTMYGLQHPLLPWEMEVSRWIIMNVSVITGISPKNRGVLQMANQALLRVGAARR